ncbi:MAG TPA: hypothetical protein VFG23_13500 [Polyangia bacterium]|nr:hypothetical protein [Polyangia bacterium]
MNRRLALWTGLGALLIARAASAQDVTIGYQGLPYKSTGENNTGIQVSDDLILHTGIGVEAGYDTNVFYSPAGPLGAPVGSSIVRVMPFLELTNATRTGPVSRDVAVDARVGLLYRYYGSDNSDVKKYRSATMPNAGLSIGLGNAGQFGFGVADVFSRIEDAPYQAQLGTVTNPLTRDNNQLSLIGSWSPGGGRLTSQLRFTDMLDFYDAPYTYANATTNTLALDVAWKWLPKTAIFLDVQQQYIYYFDNTTITDPATMAVVPAKDSAYPLRVTAGLRGLLTPKTSAVLSVGYVNGFYSGSGGSTTGFLGSTYAELALTVKVSELSRLVLGVRHDFLNAVISSFSYEETAYASYLQQIAGRLALDLSARYAYLSYEGTFVDPTQRGRVDNLFQAGASLDYFLRNWAYLGVGYSLLDNSSNIGADSYVKQQIFGRLGITY